MVIHQKDVNPLPIGHRAKIPALNHNKVLPTPITYPQPTPNHPVTDHPAETTIKANASAVTVKDDNGD